MPMVDNTARFLTCKLVYLGPARAGTSTNVSYLHSTLPDEQVANLTSLATRRDRPLFFDDTAAEPGTVGAYHVRFQRYTLPGQPHNRAIRQLVLHGADGIAFVAESRRTCLEEHHASLQDLHRDLADQAVAARSLPFVFQFNKQALPADEILSAEELSHALNFRNAPEFVANARDGIGIFDTLHSLGRPVLRRLGTREVLQPDLLEASA